MEEIVTPQSDSICVGTLNLRNTADRWKERRWLLVDQFVELQPDVIGFQEVHRWTRQAKWIAKQVNMRLSNGPVPYQVYQTNKTGLLQLREGIAIMTRLQAMESDSLDLRGGNRVAQRIRVVTPRGRMLDFYNTHLHHPLQAGQLRTEQARRIIAWMAEHPGVPQVLVGDFNCQPGTQTIQLIHEHLRSAYDLVHGHAPAATYPTPLRPGGEGIVIDYIFVNDLVQVHDAWLTFDKTHPADQHLAASDHYGLAAMISL